MGSQGPLPHRPSRSRSDGHSALNILRQAIRRYIEAEASQAAAGLAYYLFFSLFPLALVLVAAATYIWNLGTEEGFQRAVAFISQILPVSRDLIIDNLEIVLRLRGAITPIGLLSALWSASSAFTILSHNISRAWVGAKRRSFVGKRLMALAMVGVLTVLLFLSLSVTTLMQYLPHLKMESEGLRAIEAVVRSAAARLIPFVLSMFIFLGLYRWVPTQPVTWRAAAWGAGCAALGWEIAKRIFAWLLQRGLLNYSQVYGSLAGVALLLLWTYVGAGIVLFGAHIAAAIDNQLQLPEIRKQEPQTTP